MTQYKHPTIDDLRHHTEVGTGFTKDAMLNIAADWIEALQAELSASTTTDTVTGWISVKDRLPDYIEGKDYSAIVFGFYDGGIGVFCRFFDGDTWGWARAFYAARDLAKSECEFDDDYNVTHWMPLPKPPIDKAKDE